VADWFDRLAHAPDPFFVMCAVLTLIAFGAGYTGLRRARHIEDVPTARVRSAPQGYVELIGQARSMDGELIVAPLSKTECCWFEYRVERRGNKDWRTIESATSDGIFLLRDETGECVIDPEGAEVTSRHKQRWADDGSGWGGHAVHARLPSLGRTADLVVKVGGKVLEGLGSGMGRYRYTESVILDGDSLYAVGQFHSVGASGDGNTRRELTGAILREWKRQPETLRERFDRNRDGVVDLDEWENARAIADREAAREQAEHDRAAPLHILKKPTDGRYFLLSNLEEFDLLRRYRWRMRIGFSLFLLLGGALSLMVSTRF